MSVIPILIIVSVVVAIIFLIAFFWAVRSGQYEDTHSPAVRILFDDKPQTTAEKDVKEENVKENTDNS